MTDQPKESEGTADVRGKLFVASMNLRGSWAEPIDKDTVKINVTSAQAKKSQNRLDFSPMTQIQGGYKGYWNFQSYWQSGKVYADVPIKKSKEWWKNLKQAKRRYPGSKGKKPLYALFDGIEEKLDKIASRKKVYVPQYSELIKNRKMLKHWRNQLKKGKSLTVYDFDGPRKQDGGVQCKQLTKQLLIEKINNGRFPFGHGYVVAAEIAQIQPKQYCNI